MKELLQQAKEILEYTYDHPSSNDLARCIEVLEEAKETAGTKKEMLENIIRSVTQAQNAQRELDISGDVASSSAFGQAYRAIDQAIESYS
ncbi:hypothetical protein [Bacillus sp. CECT 9360]|uniref:hypothetical protein n=1 Tax=Bacillus sp. CECT 9360 TaxID=2845821 RepID=UPI001E48E2FE|nr:hypothetical protein [Bacillus sp. CECT 9360]CAH0345221.1 hypothetical protein BCI9360_01500 [Bacillus sp. CECT 9360]